MQGAQVIIHTNNAHTNHFWLKYSLATKYWHYYVDFALALPEALLEL